MRYFIAVILLLPLSLFAQKKGQALIDSMLKELPKLKEDTNKVNMLNAISFGSNSINPDEGIKYGQQALELATKLKWKAGIANADNRLGVNYWRKSDDTKALEYYAAALKIFVDIDYKIGVAKVTINMGSIYYSQSNYPDALKYYFNGLKMIEETGHKEMVAAPTGNIGRIYENQGDYPLALEYYFKALKIDEELGDKYGAAAHIVNIGNVYSRQSDYPRALEYFFKALKMDEEIGNKADAAKFITNIGSVYVRQSDYSSALQYYFRALKMDEEIGDKGGEAAVTTCIGDDYTQQKNYIMAIAYGKKALQMSEEIGDKWAAVYALGSIGEAYLSLAQDSAQSGKETLLSLQAGIPDPVIPTGKATRLHLAIDYLQRGLDSAKKINVLNVMKNCYQGLAEAYKINHDYKKALESYQNYTAIKDSIFSKENKTKITNLEHQRELDLKENQIKLLEQQYKVTDLKAQKEKLIRRIMTGGTIMTIILATLMVMYFVRKQQHEKQVASEKINTLLKDQELRSVSDMLDAQEGERNRIASDLHDRLGSMLSTVKLYFNSVEEQIDVMKEQNRNQYHKATSLLDEACDEVRKISHDLVSGELVKFGLVPALMQLKETIENTGKLKMQVLAFGMEKRLEGNVEISLYRVVQELMNNILNHSKADKVTIQLNRVEGNLNIVVEDNGVGFDVAAARLKEGMGLKNLETRINKLSGTISIDSGRGRGATTIVDIPV